MHKYRAFLTIARCLRKPIQVSAENVSFTVQRRNIFSISRALCKQEWNVVEPPDALRTTHPTQLHIEKDVDDVTAESSSSKNENRFVVKLKGLPYSVTPEEVAEFLGDVNLPRGKDSIHLTHCQFGIAFVYLSDRADVQKAVRKHRLFLGSRYIEVTEVSLEEAESDTTQFSRQNTEESKFYVVMRGIPFTATKQDIVKFFAECNVSENNVWLVKTPSGMLTGQAYVKLSSAEETEMALKYHKENMQNRYIEIYQSTEQAYHNAINRGVRTSRERSFSEREFTPATESRNTIRLRGLPFNASMSELVEFFRPLEPSGITIMKNEWGRSNGQAIVSFSSSQEMIEALKKDRAYIGNRYIEITAELAT